MADTQNKRWAEDKNRFGYKLLQKLGWQEGKGIGKNEDGMVSHVKVSKRPDTLGLGVEVDQVGNKAFRGQIAGLNDVLKSLNEAHGSVESSKKRARESDASSDDESDDDKSSKTPSSDGEVAEKKSRKKKKEEDSSSEKTTKKKKKEKKEKKAKKAKKNKKQGESLQVARKAHAKLVRAKDVSRYSASDLNAILGVAAQVRDTFQAIQAST